MSQRYSRRSVLAMAGGGLAATVAPVRHAFAQVDDRPWFFLTDDEARWLAAIADVFIPEDAFPSASQAGVVDYIDFQMATDYGRGDGLYLQGPFPEGTPEQGYQLPHTPAELIRAGIAGARREADLARMDGARREAWVTDLSERDGRIGDVPAGTFFSELLSLTNEGYFADPIYLGNKGYAGWDMVGFPGAHAYYLDLVDDHNRAYRRQPMGVAHDPSGRSTLPRPVGQGEMSDG